LGGGGVRGRILFISNVNFTDEGAAKLAPSEPCSWSDVKKLKVCKSTEKA